jgi:tRNA(Ile)-lysidine synthetase-like protein
LHLNKKFFFNYLQKNFSPNQKVLISLSCGLDSTVLYYLILQADFFKSKNLFYVFFDHQKRAEGKYEILQFIQHYKIPKKNLIINKINLGQNKNSFQKNARQARHLYFLKLSKTLKTKEIFLGHHFDDLKESYFLRKIQSSNIFGLSNIFNEQIDSLNIHRPLVYFTKDKIRSYAKKNKLLWFEDRSNFELDYTRNKVRHYFSLNSNVAKVIEREIVSLNDIEIVKKFYTNFFFKISNQKFEIKVNQLMNLNKTLQILVVQSFYYNSRLFLKKQPRFENILNFIKIISSFKKDIFIKRSVFGGKIASFDKKICLNLT